ncbi:MAG: endonuclease III domain-containing protein, partial [Thermodesulfobacteriota bacterium]|nr:endonuclease III domain-containing protein [Thermodesulfobacteriota bacterium]
DYIKPAGYYNLKAKRLKNLITYINDRYNGDIDKLFSLDINSIREGLLSVNGVGLETADSIVLYGAGLPLFVIDTYTYRILTRHGLVDEDAGYSDLQAIFMDNLPNEVALFKEFHALIVKTGKEFCRKKPLCSKCPLINLNSEIY